MAAGYNDTFSTLADAATYSIGDADPASFVFNRIGMAIGAGLSLMAQKQMANVGKVAVTSIGTNTLLKVASKEGLMAGETQVARQITKTVGNNAKAGTQKAAQFGEKYFANGELVEVTKKAGRNRFSPDAKASGAHSVFRRDAITGKITHYETFRPKTNSFNPKPWESIKRYDGPGVDSRHYNKVLKKYIDTPHIHDSYVPGGIRFPEKWEIPN